MSKMNATEKKSALAIAFMIALRMYGLFLILPVFAVYAPELSGATPLLIGLAIGIYGLTQAALQIPMGFLSDIWGRKRVMALGLMLFIIGSVIAALAEDIIWIVVGRLVQGMGAIASTGLALVADVSRPEQRGKMMGIIGSMIGLSFMLAFITGPVLASQFGLSGLFWIIALLAILALGILIFVIEEPVRLKPRDYQFTELFHCIKQPGLLIMDFNVFALHASMTALFIVLPSMLISQFDWMLNDHWKLYLPVLILSIGVMVPLLVWQEKKQAHMKIMTVSLLLLSVVLLMLNTQPLAFGFMSMLLVIYFGLFNYLEASMPSHISKIADEKYRGAAMGVFSTGQFLGAFVGGVIGGLLLSISDSYVLIGAAVLVLIAGGLGILSLKRKM